MEARFTSLSFPAMAREHHAGAAPAAGLARTRDETYTVELRSAADVRNELEAWRGLAERALEPTPFADPDVLLSALQHLPDGRQAVLLLVWRRDSGRALTGLFPLLMPRTPFGPHEARLWQPDLLRFALPLIHAEHAARTLEAAFAFCASSGRRYGRLSLPDGSLDSPLRGALQALTHAKGMRLRGTDTEHAPLLTLIDAGHGGRRAHRLGLGRAGLSVTHARSPLQIRDGVETFLLVEAAAAKARAGRAIVQDPGAATFVRTMTRQLGHRNRCRVEMVRRDGQGPAAAIAIAIDHPDALWAWMTAAPDSDPAGEWLAAHLAATVRRQGKRLFVIDEGSLSPGTAAGAGLAPLVPAELLVPLRRRPAGVAEAGAAAARIERPLAAIRTAGRRRTQADGRAMLPRGAIVG